MSEQETIKLLKECNAGCKTALDGLSLVQSHVSSPELKSAITTCQARHNAMKDRCHNLLSDFGKDDAEPPAIGSAMMNIGTELKLAVNSSDEKIAELMTDGCHMGIKSLAKQYNRFKGASEESRTLAADIIREEQKFLDKMIPFL